MRALLTSLAGEMDRPADQLAEVALWLDVRAFEMYFVLSNQWIGWGRSAKRGARLKCWWRILCRKPIPAPVIYFRRAGTIARPRIREARFMDGRHRYAVLRDAGIRRLKVWANKRDAELAMAAGVATEV